MQHISIVDFCLDVHETNSWLQMCRKYDLKLVLYVTTFLKNYLSLSHINVTPFRGPNLQ